MAEPSPTALGLEEHPRGDAAERSATGEEWEVRKNKEKLIKGIIILLIRGAETKSGVG